MSSWCSLAVGQQLHQFQEQNLKLQVLGACRGVETCYQPCASAKTRRFLLTFCLTLTLFRCRWFEFSWGVGRTITGKVDCKELNRAKCLHSFLVSIFVILPILPKMGLWHDGVFLGVRRKTMSKLFFVPSQLAICRLRGEIWWPGWRMHVSWWEILLSKENLWEAVVALRCFVWLVVLNQTTTLWLIFFSKSQIYYSAQTLHKKQFCAWCFFFGIFGTIVEPQDFAAKTVSWMCHFLCSQGWFMQHKTTTWVTLEKQPRRRLVHT